MLTTLLWLKVLDDDNKNNPETGGIGLLFLFPFIILILAIITLPALLYWQYRNGSKKTLAFTVALTAILFYTLMPYARDDFWQAALFIEICASLLGAIIYLHVLACRYLTKVVGKNANAKLDATSWVWWGIVTLGVFLLCYGAVVCFFHGGAWLTNVLYKFMRMEFFSQSLTFWHFDNVFREYVGYVLALSPAAIASSLLLNLFRRRVSEGKGAVPWHFKIPAVGSVILYMGFALLVMHVNN